MRSMDDLLREKKEREAKKEQRRLEAEREEAKHDAELAAMKDMCDGALQMLSVSSSVLARGDDPANAALVRHGQAGAAALAERLSSPDAAVRGRAAAPWGLECLVY